jgi:UDP-N-acetylmuramoyl-tripeptide--D-alanyl-D-alanine ligase
MRISASEVARITNGRLVGADAIANGISFDTRTLLSGQVFVAVLGERDGHEHLVAAAEEGAAFAIVSAGRSVSQLPCVETHDTVAALGQIANDCRVRLSSTLENRVIGITGSAGKTSTKNMVFAVLSSRWLHAHAAMASLNNDIGLPATIINAPDNCDALVLEMGMRGFGEIARLCNIAQPAISVVTNVGDAHSDRVNGIEGVAKAKSEIVTALDVDGVAVLNADDERVKAMSSLAKGRVVTFGTSTDADVRVDLISTNDKGVVTASFSYAGSSQVGVVPLPGAHMMLNAAAAVAVGITCGVSLSDAVSALENTVSETGRMQWHTSETGLRVIDDSYNANTSSMMAALRVLTGVHASQRIAVLGQMAEITDAPESHRSIARFCEENNIELLSLETDMYGTDALSVDEVIQRVSDNTDTVVLVKGSRAARTERVVNALLT